MEGVVYIFHLQKSEIVWEFRWGWNPFSPKKTTR